MSRRSRRRKHRKPKQHRLAAELSESLQLLRQGNLNAASHVASQAYKYANNQHERESAGLVLAEIRFREAIKKADPTQKLAALTEALQAASGDVRLHFHRGITLLQTGNPVDALLEFDTVVNAEPNREGLSFFHQLASAAVKKSSKMSNSCSPAEANTLKIVQELQKRPSSKSVNVAFEEPLFGLPPMWSALLRLRHDKSYMDFPAIKELVPDRTAAPVTGILAYYQGVAAMRADAVDAALNYWQQAMAHGFSEPWLQKNIGIVMRGDYVELMKAGEWHKLVKMAHQLPAGFDDDVLNQMFSLALFHIGYEQAQKDQWSQALKSWNDAAKWSHSRYLAQNIALAHEKLGQWQQAADAWREMLKRRPRKEGHPDYLNDKQVAAIWAHAAECYINDWCDDEAVKCFRKAIEYAPDDVKLRFKLVSAYMDKEYWNPDAAIRELNGILEVQPENIEALTQLAHLYEQNWRQNPMPVWEKILQSDPDNSEARQKMVKKYLDQIFPENAGGWYYGKKLTYTQKLALLDEALKLIPEDPELIVSLGIVHLDAKKNALAKEQFLRAYACAPQKPGIAASVLQNLIHVEAADEIEKILPEILTIPGLLPVFWIDQGREAFDHLDWATRFFDEAIEHARSSGQASVASVLVDIYLSIIEEGGDKKLQRQYMQKIQAEAPNSGALEYIDAFTGFQRTGDANKARRLLRTSKKLAKAANDAAMLQLIEGAEKILSPGSPFKMMGKLFGMGGEKFDDGMFDDKLLEDLLNKMKGFI